MNTINFKNNQNALNAKNQNKYTLLWD